MALVFPALLVLKLGSWFYFSSIRFIFKAQLFTRPKIGLFSLASHPMDFKYSCTRISSSMGWTNRFKALLRPLFGRVCLELVFLCFILISKKAYKQYIPTSRYFYSSLGLSLLMNEIMEIRFIYPCIENPNHIFII